MNAHLLTETADYDTPGSWGTASNGWPSLLDADMQIRRYVIAHPEIVPYGAYVTVGDRLRIHANYFDNLKDALAAAPSAPLSEEADLQKIDAEYDAHIRDTSAPQGVEE